MIYNHALVSCIERLASHFDNIQLFNAAGKPREDDHHGLGCFAGLSSFQLKLLNLPHISDLLLAFVGAIHCHI